MAICSMPKRGEPFFFIEDHEFAYLNSERSVTRKMIHMANMLSLTREEHCERERIVSDIFNMLRPYYPECDILVFGSSANGFGFKGCDLDLLFMPFPEYCNMDFKGKGSGIIPTPHQVSNGIVSRNELYHMDEEMHLKFVRSIMRRYIRRYFRKIIFIPAKCPILNIGFSRSPLNCDFSDFKDKGSGIVPTPYHVLKGTISRNKLYQMDEEMHLKFVQRVMYTTKRYFKKAFLVPAKCPILDIEFVFSPLHCDLSVSNRLVLYNTQLLWVYGKLDSRVKPLVMFIRFWTKSLGFISKSLLSSYCLTILVIFYLQNTHPAVLPSVRYLNEKAGYSRIIDGWETAICVDPVYKSGNRKSPSELLMEFFDFYWDFDFIQNIVSVYDGKPLPVELVKESNDERIKTFPVTPLSVQDPFILSRNISRNTSMKTPFKLSLMIAKELLCQKDFDLRWLFDPTYYQDEINRIFAPTKNYLPPGSMFLTLQLTYEIFSKLAVTSQLNPWFNKVSQGVLDILQHGLLLECEVVDKAVLDSDTVEPPSKRRKFNVRNIGDLKLIISIQCVVNFPTLWRRNRAEVLEHLKKTDASFEVEDSEVEIPSSLKTEYIISKELSKDEIKEVTKLPEFNSQPPYFSFACDCFRYSESKLSDIVICFSPITNRKTFNEAKEFLKTFVRKHIKCILEED